MLCYCILSFAILGETSAGWVKDGWKPRDIPFSGEPGATAAAGHLGAESEPVDYFGLFLTDELLQMLVVETNRYAKQCIDKVSGALRACRSDILL